MKFTSADRLLLRTLRDGGVWNVLLLAVGLARSGGALLLPALLARAVDERLAGDAATALTQLAVLAAALVAADIAGQLISPWYVSTATILLRSRLLLRILHMGTDARGRHSSGDLTSRLLTNTLEAGSVLPVATTWLSSVLVSGGGLIALGLIDPWLAAAFLAGMPAAVFLVRSFVGQISPLLTRYLELQGRLAGRLMEVAAGIRTVRAAGTERREVERVLGELPALHRAGMDSWRSQATVNLRAGLLMPLMQVAVLATAGYLLSSGRITPGEMAASAAYVGMALGLFGQAGILMALAQARAGARRIEEVDAAALPFGDETLAEGPGTLTFQSVTAGGEEAGAQLDRITLTLPGGTATAVVGGSGSGKSLLAAVAGRMIAPTSGTVALDGIPLERLHPEELRDAVGWAFERPVYLGASLREAIGFGTPGISADAVEEAAAQARADRFIRRLPAGYATPPGDAPLSGGERQRIGLARALAHGGRLLILDDATSSLDSATEAQVGAAIFDGLASTTKLVLTHRVSTASRADLVAWLDGGRLRALAPHRQLWRDADYRGLFQTSGADESGADLAHAR